MNSFAHIKRIARFKKVSYYSLCLNNCETSLFEEFIKYHEKKNKDKLNHILTWIKIIGDKYGAQERLFRHEALFADTSALPPKGKDRIPSYTESGETKANNIRLYCLRANENVVFLFNGDLKTTQNAQDCPNNKDHFKLANQLSKAINLAFKENNIHWNDDYTSLNYTPNLKLYF